MRVRSWEQVGLDQGKTLFFVSLLGASFFALIILVGALLKLGAISAILGGLIAAAAGYLVSSAPKRIVSRIAFQQTLEGPAFAASSSIYLRSTSSRSKTFLFLWAEEPRLQSFLAAMKKKILTGYDSAAGLRDKRMETFVFSESVMSVLNSIVSVDKGKLESGPEELDGMLTSMNLDDETKLPLLMAVSFFLPIMLMLFAAMTKNTGPIAMVAMAVFEIVVLDIVSSISSNPVVWTKQKRRSA